VDAGVPSGQVFEAPDAIAAATVAQAVVQARDTVLVKGSRGVGLELVVEGLAARFKQGVSDTGN
jgi:UDP-N-acetylmuramyl pentapeptide synthase